MFSFSHVLHTFSLSVSRLTPHLPLPLFSLSPPPPLISSRLCPYFLSPSPPHLQPLTFPTSFRRYPLEFIPFVALRSFNCSSIYNSLPFLSHQSLFRLPPLNLTFTLPQSLSLSFSLSFSLFLLFFSFSYLNHSTPLPQQQPKVSRFYFYFLLHPFLSLPPITYYYFGMDTTTKTFCYTHASCLIK
jgi:hypothetical protein